MAPWDHSVSVGGRHSQLVLRNRSPGCSSKELKPDKKEVSSARMWEVDRSVAPIWVPAPYCVQVSGARWGILLRLALKGHMTGTPLLKE